MSHVPVRETYTLPAAAPFENHGRTRASWVLFWVVCAGVLVACVGIIVSPIMMWVGLGVVVLGVVASFILAKLGQGQPRSLTDTAKAGSWYDN